MYREAVLERSIFLPSESDRFWNSYSGRHGSSWIGNGHMMSFEDRNSLDEDQERVYGGIDKTCVIGFGRIFQFIFLVDVGF